MFVGVCKLDLHLPGHRSLKEKRRVLRQLKDKVMQRFGIPLSEVGSLDLWQRTEVGFAVTGNGHTNINSLIDKIIGFIEGSNIGHIIDRKTEIINF